MLRVNIFKKMNNGSKAALLSLLAYFIIPALVYLPYLINGHVMAHGDSYSWLSMRSLLAQSFISGDPSLWNPFSMLGVPYMADIQSGFFYPLNYLVLIMPLNVFSNVYYIITLALAGFFTYLYMSEIQDSKLVAFLVGLVFMFSTFLGGPRVTHQNVFSSVIWLPLVLFFVQRYIRTNRRKELLFASVAMAFQFFAGFPQAAIYSNLFVLLYLIVFMKKDKNSVKRRILDLSIWLGVFIMLIAVQLLPLAELMKDSGRNAVSYEFFSVLSADYRVLPLAFFPELFGDAVFPFGARALEVGIEIYVGIIATVFLVYAMIFHMKEKKIRWLVIFAALSLMYCMVANIPIIGKAVWNIPIIGSFRVASRMIFVYSFFSIAVFGIILSKLKDRVEAKKLFKFSLVFFIVILVIVVFIKSVASSSIADQNMQQYYDGVKVFLPTIIITLILAGILAAYSYFKFLCNWKHAYIAMACIICLAGIADVGRYSIPKGDFDYYGDKDNTTSAIQYLNGLDNNDEYRSVAVLATLEEAFDINKADEYKFNSNMFYQMRTYNSYLTFRSKKATDLIPMADVPMSGINNYIHGENAALSMASLKYIVDPYHDLTKEDVIVGMGDLFQEIPEVNIPSSSQVNAQSYKMGSGISENQRYYVEFEATTDKNPQMFYIDFWGEGYDLEECNTTFILQPETNTYSGMISTGNQPVPDDVYFRIISQNDSDIRINDFKMYNVISVPFNTVYKTLVDDGDTLIYENVNAKPIINIAADIEDISQYNAFDINEISYIENPKREDVGSDAAVKILQFNNNSIKAKVVANEEVFINHAQIMYPGWNAYVDGIRVQNYLVNKTIQGVYVPKGEHIVEFRFEPVSFYIGAAVTLTGVILLILLLLRKKV